MYSETCSLHKDSNAVFQYHDIILYFAHDDVMILLDTSGQLEFDSHYTCNYSHSVYRYRLYILHLGACCDTTTTVIQLSARIVWYRPVLCGFWPWRREGCHNSAVRSLVRAWSSVEYVVQSSGWVPWMCGRWWECWWPWVSVRWQVSPGWACFYM